MTIQPGSRYEDADHVFVAQHFYDIYGHPLLIDQDGAIRFIRSNAEATYRLNTLPQPPAPPVEYFARDSEHFPFIAFKFMNDSTRWWEVAAVNPRIWYPLDLLPGDYLNVPS